MPPNSTSPAAEVLIVDDSLDNLNVLSAVLQSHGYSVRGARSGRAALHAIEAAPPDLVLLDILMPEPDGYDVCRQLKANPALRDMPVIFLSALDSTFDIVRAFQAGGADYIVKPFRLEEIVARVRHQITILNLQRELRAQNLQLQDAKAGLEEAYAAKSQFLAYVNHELRNPLAAIVGIARLLQTWQQQPKSDRKTLARYVEMLDCSATHLLDLTNDVLDLAKLEVGGMVLETDTIDLQEFLVGLDRMWEPEASRRGLEWHIESPPHLPACIRADRGKLRQVLVNLLSNSMKFTQTGGISLVLRVFSEGADVPDAVTLAFAVTDTGPGIGPAECKRLFSPFVQGAAGRQIGQGTGLGLQIAWKLTELMGGTLTVESEVGRGTSFQVTVPACLAARSDLRPN